MYQYPPRVNKYVKGFGIVLLFFSISEYALEWVRAGYATLFPHLSLPFIPLLEPYQNVLRSLLIAHLGLLATLLAVRALLFMVPKIELRETGLVFSTAAGSSFIPYAGVQRIHSVELPESRFVVWVHSKKGLPLQGLIASLLFGQRPARGFVLTSDLKGFDDVLASIVSDLKFKHGEEGFAERWHEQSPTWQMRMLAAPQQTIHDAVVADEPPFDLRNAALHMIWTALTLTLPLIVGCIIRLQIPWWGIFLVVMMGVLEWPLISAYLSILPIGDARRMELESALAVYPLTQLRRWVSAVFLALLVAAGIPGSLLLLAALPAVALGSIPVLMLTEEWFEIKLPESALGVIATVIYQTIMYEVLLLMVPR